MSKHHPIIAITGSSGSGTTDVTKAFDHIFWREKINALFIQGNSFHRYARKQMQLECLKADAAGFHFSHFGPNCNMLAKLESLFHNYSANGFLQEHYEACNASEYLTRIQYLDTKTYLAEDIMTKVDRASMLCSLETRAPLLDHELLELASKIPANLHLKNGTTKYIFKKSLQGVLPDNILYRKKMGFGVPLVHWFKGELVDVNLYGLLRAEWCPG